MTCIRFVSSLWMRNHAVSLVLNIRLMSLTAPILNRNSLNKRSPASEDKSPPSKFILIWVEVLISFLVSCGSSTTRIELLDFFGLQPDSPSASAFNQQRAKLRPEALEAIFYRFNSTLETDAESGFRFLAADGSTFTFFSRPSFSPPEYFVSKGHSAKGFYSMHLNALYDLQRHTYSDALIQPVHGKNEFRAFCHMVDRHASLT